MVELGDQKLDVKVSVKTLGERVWAKEYFERLGFYHYCIDLHGMNGAHPIDLCRTIDDPFWIGKFDVLTNCGTSEHVLDQHMCWENIHNLVKVGGIFIHVLPKIGCWPDHSPYAYQHKFLVNLSIINHYRVIFVDYLTSVKCYAACLIKQKPDSFHWSDMGVVENSNEDNTGL